MSEVKKEKMKVLTKEAILSMDDLPIEEVKVPEWNGTVRMRSLSGKERDEFESAVQFRSKGNRVDIKELKVTLLSLTIVDEENKLIFTKEDLTTLNAKSAKAIDQLFAVATKMNGIGEEAVKELGKNLSGDQSVASGSD